MVKLQFKQDGGNCVVKKIEDIVGDNFDERQYWGTGRPLGKTKKKVTVEMWDYELADLEAVIVLRWQEHLERGDSSKVTIGSVFGQLLREERRGTPYINRLVQNILFILLKNQGLRKLFEILEIDMTEFTQEIDRRDPRRVYSYEKAAYNDTTGYNKKQELESIKILAFDEKQQNVLYHAVTERRERLLSGEATQTQIDKQVESDVLLEILLSLNEGTN